MTRERIARGRATAGPLPARIGGAILRQVFRAILLVRRPRPIHSRGLILRGHITWLDSPVRSGIGWVDERPASALPVVARVSRSVGLPSPLPDIYGLALRFEANGQPADIELASTGLGPLTRFALLPHRSPARARFGTLLPYRSARGPRLLAARTVAPAFLPPSGLEDALTGQDWRLRLYVASTRGAWHPFAELSLRAQGENDDPGLRFDAVRHPLPGAKTYPWVRALRQPSYRLAQGTADGDAPSP